MNYLNTITTIASTPSGVTITAEYIPIVIVNCIYDEINSITNIKQGQTAIIQVILTRTDSLGGIEEVYVSFNWGIYGIDTQIIEIEGGETIAVTSSMVISGYEIGSLNVFISGVCENIIPIIIESGWILVYGYWEDTFYWVDNEFWKDN